MSLEMLRQLPLAPEARLVLLEQLRSAPPETLSRSEILGELAELRLRCCEDAYQSQAWDAALEHHDALVELVSQLVALAPQQREAYWSRYAELLSFLTVAVHGAVNPQCTDGEERARRADLAWQLAGRLSRAAGLPVQWPDWHHVHEEQLVQMGVLLHTDLLATTASIGTDPSRPLLQQRSLDLMLRLAELLRPTPPWLSEQLRPLVQARVTEVFEQDSPEPAALAELLTLLGKLPVEPERAADYQAALTRARLSLELLAPDLAVGDGAAGAPLDPGPPAAAAAVVAEMPPPGLADMVWLDPGASASPLQLDLGPLLCAEPEQIEEALDDFCWHLPRGIRALPASRAIAAALEPRWRLGMRLEAPAFERLACLAASWQRRLADRLEPLPLQAWRDGLLVELAAGELDVLPPLLKDPQQLEAVMAELRREHHNPSFWQQRVEVPWMQCPPALEALRRLHVEEGFYARSHEPLESLRLWGREVALALVDSEPWTDDAGCLGRWLAVSQELVLSGRGPVPELGQPPMPDQLLADLGGLEVVYVGEGAAAVQAAHRSGRGFRGEPFGLRVLQGPASLWPSRPAGCFEQSLAVLLEEVEALYRQRPFAVLLADCGAYRLPLLRTVHQRYGVAAVSSCRPMASWLTGG